MKKRLLNQKQLARELRITDRRVRQLVDERIIPLPNDDGLYDADRAGRRYDVYRDPDPAALQEFAGAFARKQLEVDQLVEAALKPEAGKEAMRRAFPAADELMQDVELFLRLAYKEAPEMRDLQLELHRSKSKEAYYQPLLQKAYALMAAERGNGLTANDVEDAFHRWIDEGCPVPDEATAAP